MIDLEKATVLRHTNEVKDFCAKVEIVKQQMTKIEGRFEELDKSTPNRLEVFELIEKESREIHTAMEHIKKVEKRLKETDVYLDNYLPMHIMSQIDETIYATISKKSDLLKALTDFEKVKFKALEEKLKAPHSRSNSKMGSTAHLSVSNHHHHHGHNPERK